MQRRQHGKRTIGIIGGKGIMGSFFRDFFRKHGYRVLVSDVKTTLSNTELVRKSDVVIFSVPIHVTQRVIRGVLPFVRQEHLLMDVTSLKSFPVREMKKSAAEVIGLHPLFRPQKNIGWKEQTVAMCAARASRANKIWIKKLIKADGGKIIEMTPSQHDRLMGIVQVLVHFHTILFGATLRTLQAPLRQTLQVMSPVYRLEFDLIARIFAQNPRLYAAIEMWNPETKKILRTLKQQLLRLKKIIEQKNERAFIKEFEEIRKFLGSYTDKALEESNFILQQFSKKGRLRA